MTNRFVAIYEGGVLRPLYPPPFAEQERVTITVAPVDEDDDDIDHDFIARCQAEVAKMAHVRTLAETRNLLANVPGSFAELIIQEREDR